MKICSSCKKEILIDEILKGNSYCKLCRAQNARKWRSNNKNKVKKNNQTYYNEKGGKEKKVLYDKENLENTRNRDNEKYKNDLNFRLKKILRTRLNKVLNGKRKEETTINLLGCNLEFFKSWIEYQFDKHMSWENYGIYWNIDHVKPCSSYNLDLKHEQQECFHWENTRPLEKRENESKNKLVDKNIITKHKEFVQNYKILVLKIN